MTSRVLLPADVRFNKRRLFEHCRYRPHAGQVHVHRSKARYRILACGVRWGKTLAAAMEAIAAALEPKEHSIGWVVAPTYDLCERVFSRICMLMTAHFRHRIVSLRIHSHHLVVRNLGGGISEIKGKSSDNPVSLLGEGLDWVIMDEAARMKPLIWQNHISQRLIDKKGWALLISTPRGKGWFYDEYRRGESRRDPDYESWNFPSWSSPLLDAAAIGRERERLPERVFDQEYGGKFLEGSGAVFRNVRECATGDFQAPDFWERQPYWAGLDIGRTVDYTVLVIMNGAREVVYRDRFNGVPWHTAIERVCRALRSYKNATVFIDSSGKGEPIFEMLRDSTQAYVKPYVFTNKSKSAIIDSLAILFDEKKIVIPKPEIWPEAVDELEAFQYEYTEAGTLRTAAPGGMHDDCVIALALAAYDLRTSRKPFDQQWEKIEDLGL